MQITQSVTSKLILQTTLFQFFYIFHKNNNFTYQMDNDIKLALSDVLLM